MQQWDEMTVVVCLLPLPLSTYQDTYMCTNAQYQAFWSIENNEDENELQTRLMR